MHQRATFSVGRARVLVLSGLLFSGVASAACTWDSCDTEVEARVRCEEHRAYYDGRAIRFGHSTRYYCLASTGAKNLPPFGIPGEVPAWGVRRYGAQPGESVVGGREDRQWAGRAERFDQTRRHHGLDQDAQVGRGLGRGDEVGRQMLVVAAAAGSENAACR